ncbi:hypothetical protein Pint_15814 [Pistacia integerrima]|uniref:Uncharacterized protein n=1 Tax=Pistacia integerrima TaxID=434235 RepID=A0ACC0ZDH9_9ROSI|nr:hypothetical protein Pint_15814 [Pistacia integerrima]
MPEFNLRADTIMYNIVIRLFCEKGDMVMAHKLMKEMGLIDLYPDMITNVSMINGFCNVGSMQMTLELSGEMEKEVGDCSSNVVTYSSVIQSFCRKGRVMEGLAVLDRIQAYGCAPNRVTVSTLIKGLCLDGIEEAYELIDKVVAGGSVLHGDCYNSLVIALVRIKRLKEADKLFRKMLASGMKPNGLACSVMIKELCLEG